MDCPRRFLLLRYKVGDLPLQTMLEIREHLEGCEYCRCFLREMERRRREFLRRHPVDQVIPTGGRLRRWWRWVRVWLGRGCV